MKNLIVNIKTIIEIIKSYKKNVVLCGLSSRTKSLIAKYNLENKITYILDNDKEKLGTKYLSIEIINQERLETLDTPLIVISGNYISLFYNQAKTIPAKNIVIEKVFQALPSKGYFMLEVRSDKDPLCGQGEAVGDNGFITTHYRRFINSNTFIQKMLQKGFILQYFTEEDNLSVFHNDNPYLIRAIFTKN